jgi:2-keto-3-deoxy-L-rhamnonate aldolase RhmA
MNKVKQKLGEGAVVHGVWLDLLDADIVELYGLLGFDYIVIDAEHAAVDRRACTELVRACDVTGMVAFVRIPELNAAAILGYLEIGVLGIYVPHVSSAIDAEAIVRAVKYAPIGNRSAQLMRTARWGLADSDGQAYERANEDTMIVALVENVSGIHSLPEILRVDQIDVVGIGDTDLAHSMGYPGRTDPMVDQAVSDAEHLVLKSGRVLDAVVSTPSAARLAIERGARMISLNARRQLVDSGQRYLAELAAGG